MPEVCKKQLPLDQFPLGSGQCGFDKRVIQNIKYAAKAQGQEAWLAEQLACPAKTSKLVATYKKNHMEELTGTKFKTMAGSFEVTSMIVSLWARIRRVHHVPSGSLPLKCPGLSSMVAGRPEGRRGVCLVE